MDQSASASGQPVPVTPPPLSSLPTPENPKKAGGWFANHPYRVVLGPALFFVVAVGVAALLQGAGEFAFSIPQTNYVPVYTLVNEKISQHGAVVINLPEGVSKEDAEEKISFDPPLGGSWVPSQLDKALVYKPSEELTVGKYYLVSLATDGGVIKKDFLVDEDPAIVDIFPSAESEAELASAVTIIFNRPMVPLTTLSELENKDIPVTITPPTKGKFKWITTRTLQFIPETTLIGSAHYTLAVQPGFVSMDGLAVAGKTHTFTTKQLRLESATNYTIGYNDPVDFRFNQPIDIEKTAREITVTDLSTNSRVAFEAEYSEKSVYDSGNGVYQKVVDKSVLRVVPKNSVRGHSNVWEFERRYSVAIVSAYAGGDIALSGPGGAPAVQTEVTTSPLLRGVSVQSEKTPLASPQLFDPSGKAIFSFYEDIDIRKSTIRAKGLKAIVYGEKCEERDPDDYRSSCKNVEDKSQLIVTFDSKAYARGEEIPVTFEGLLNTDGYQVNARAIVVPLIVYPELRIISSKPGVGTNGASVQELVLCTNVPLQTLDAKEFYQHAKANKYMVFGRWDTPYLQDTNSYENPRPCSPDGYVNRIHYGLLPQQTYTISASFDDVFGQKSASNLAFTTGAAPKFYLRFQNLQKIYSVTTPDKTSLAYATENFDYVDLSICKATPDALVQYLSTQPCEISRTPTSGLACGETAVKRIQLKPDQW